MKISLSQISQILPTYLLVSVALHACGANYPSQERAISPAARTTLHQGGSNFACGANYPHQAIKGGYFVFVWRVGTWLDLTLVFRLILDYLGFKKGKYSFKNKTFLLSVYTFLGVITPIFKSVSRKQRNIGEV